MIVQCRVCKKIKDSKTFRHPWPGELPVRVKDTFCPDCAREALDALRRGETPLLYESTGKSVAS